ncbi:MAG: preprotein translocase subunit SecA [Acidobacteria bacterium]|jgi:preprotein translocase subunit SecA|nr:preprotein translocase subunit SecA [Acidobacteriota bacterium]HJN45389.1 preprotein translocase subunit SecA [Vicinamibacterales bacterium]|tara:strand:- start:6854 stop:9745 length:2892 start_codon:yes stop_codon:yes gene_type:complete
MLQNVLKKVFGTQNERDLKRLQPMVAAINERESSVHTLSDADLRGRTNTLRERAGQGESLDDLLPDAFSVVREAGRRVLSMRHFDVQLIGGMVLHQGKIAEMKTGEGKTLVATLAAYLNALGGGGVHVVTVNDYLARRDAEWMGRLYRFLGMTVGVIQHDMRDPDRQAAYASDLTYGTNNEFGFDYLRDNMKFDLSQFVQRGHHFVIVDEVDSILIDEARTPLIISGPAEQSTELYYEVDRLIPRLEPGAVTQGDVKAEDREALEATGDFLKDEKHKTVTLTESGMAKAEQLLGARLNPGGLYDPANMPLLHHINQALRAHALFKRDVEYMVKDDQVVIVDEFTGRLMPGRRWSDGLHQAVEAKEKVKIERENQTLATVTFQNYFRKYDKLSGMTGTADTEAPEFNKIYKLDVMVIPTNRDLVRVEEPDSIYRTQREKYDAIADDIIEQQEAGRPVLTGTISIEKSERLSGLLKRRGVKHVVLNAKYHAQEAEIVAQAGRKATVTIATNMAGRGTDIVLGGNAEYMSRQQTLAEEVAERLPKEEAKFVDDEEFVYFYHLEHFYRVPRPDWERIFTTLSEQTASEHEEVVAAGGLHIVGTERHESRRIDNQLRGRAGRQGDPGSSRFYLSLEDDLMRIFGSDRISGLMEKLGMEEGVPIEHGMVTRAIERAQKQVEAQHFSVRKHLLEYDDVMNKQRENVYTLRREVLDGQIHLSDDEIVESRKYLLSLAEDLVDQEVEASCGRDVDPEEWDVEALKRSVGELAGLPPEPLGALDLDDKSPDEMHDALWAMVKSHYEEKEQAVEAEILRRVERDVMLQIVDTQWKDHLYSLDHLKEGIGLRGYAQRDPLVEYKRESFELFQAMKERIDLEMVRYLWRLRPVPQGEGAEPTRPALRQRAPVTFNDPGAAPAAFAGAPGSGRGPQPARTGGDDAAVRTMRRESPKVGRNEPCPCGSGKKYKKCHGA